MALYYYEELGYWLLDNNTDIDGTIPYINGGFMSQCRNYMCLY